MRSIITIFALLLITSATLSNAYAQSYIDRYAQWKNGPPNDPEYFPIAVWLQNPGNAKKYQQAGINLYIGLWQGPTEEQLAALKKSGMKVICSQNAVGLAHKDDPTIIGWMHNDEPDNAQPVTDPNTGERTYGPPVPPQKVIDDYKAIQEKDPTRPVFLNLGQGVANDEWKGRGKWGKPEDYLSYWKGCDLLSFDVYPVAGIRKPDGENYLWYVAKGVQRLIEWSGGEKTVWNCIECTHISDANAKATPEQVAAEVWMSIVHGSMGIVYFVHEFQPKFNEDGLLDDPEMLQAVTRLNQRIHSLAPILNSPTIADAVTVRSSNPDVPIETMVKNYQGKMYVFSVGMRNGETQGTFTIKKQSATIESKVKLLFENRENRFRKRAV